MTDKVQEYLDSLDDELFISFIWLNFGTRIPIWERCSKKEYEKYNGKAGEEKLTFQSLLKLSENLLCSGREYRKIPVYHNGGGILDKISGKKQDTYYYEKCVGYNEVLMLGNEMTDYCRTRECMKPYFVELNKDVL